MAKRDGGIMHLTSEQVASVVERAERAEKALRLAREALALEDLENGDEDSGFFWCPWEDTFIAKAKPQHRSDCLRAVALAAIDAALGEGR